MSDHEALARAHAAIAAAEAGGFDEQFGISADERALLTKAADGSHEGGGGPLTIADVTELRRIHREDLISAAYDAGRINLNPNGA